MRDKSPRGFSIVMCHCEPAVNRLSEGWAFCFVLCLPARVVGRGGRGAWFYLMVSEKFLWSLGQAKEGTLKRAIVTVLKNCPGPLMFHQRSEIN